MNLTVRKYDPADPSRVYFDEAKSLYSSTSYDLTVVAGDFKADRSSTCRVRLLHHDDAGWTEYASGTLLPDPYRRDRRVGTLVVGDAAHLALFDAMTETDCPSSYEFVLSVTLGAADAKVIYATVPLVVAPRVSSGSSGSGSFSGINTASLWSHNDLGTLGDSNITAVNLSTGLGLGVPLRDRSVTECTVDLTKYDTTAHVVVVPQTADGSAVFSGDFFDAILVVRKIIEPDVSNSQCSWASTGTTGGSLGTRVLRGGVLPPGSNVGSISDFRWDYHDSTVLSSPLSKFSIHVRKTPVDNRWHAEFRAVGANSIGVHQDPDGVRVPGVWIND